MIQQPRGKCCIRDNGRFPFHKVGTNELYFFLFLSRKTSPCGINELRDNIDPDIRTLPPLLSEKEQEVAKPAPNIQETVRAENVKPFQECIKANLLRSGAPTNRSGGDVMFVKPFPIP